MSIFSFWRRKSKAAPAPKPSAFHPPLRQSIAPTPPVEGLDLSIRRHFYNEPGFQCYASFFTLWDGWITAGHCMTDTNDMLPPFAKGELLSWPEGLDAALIGVRLPERQPSAPRRGRKVICKGYPAGARSLEVRHGTVYIERGAGSGTWIAHIKSPDEPVVTGMSGGPVIDTLTQEPIGIIITRNSPADLDHDREPDESCDFIALSAVWEAANHLQNMS